MITASDALGSIERAARGIRDDENRLSETIRSAAQEAAHLKTEQTAQFQALAKIRLDTLQQKDVVGTLSNAERLALAALASLEKKLDELEARGRSLDKDLAAAQEDRIEKAKAVATAKDAVNLREIETHKRLAENVEWQALLAKATGAGDRAVAANEKAVQSEKDRDEKSKPYLSDKLFVYLWQRGYGTSAYRGGVFARIGDGYVARTISYEEARQNYFTLTEIPRRLREHADRLRDAAEEEKARLAAFERKEMEADGIMELEKAEKAATDALDASARRIKEIENSRSTLDAERSSLVSGDAEQGMRQITADLATALARQDMQTLLRNAMLTPTPEDERIVGLLQKIEDRLDRLQRQADDARNAQIALARKRAELERAQDNFTRIGYDRRGGSFINEQLIGSIIGSIIGGAMSSRDLDDALRSGYRERPRPRNIDINLGGGFWGGGGGSWGGGGGGGGFRTGGGF